MKKNIFLLFTTLFFLFFILYFGSFFYLKNFHGLNNLELIKHKNQIAFIEKYSKRLHHLRHYVNKFVDFKNLKLFYLLKVSIIISTIKITFYF